MSAEVKNRQQKEKARAAATENPTKMNQFNIHKSRRTFRG
jgi:hypothetical protein